MTKFVNGTEHFLSMLLPNDSPFCGVNSNQSAKLSGFNFEDLSIRSRFVAGKPTRARSGVFAHGRTMSERNGMVNMKNLPCRPVVNHVGARR